MRTFRIENDTPVTLAARTAEPVDYGRSTFVDDVNTLAGAMTSRWKLVAGCAAGALALGFAYVWAATPVYTSTAEVLIDPRQSAIFEHEIVQSGMGQSSLGADTFLLDSQVDVIRSRSILRKLSAELDLVNHPEYASSGGGLIGSLVQFVLRGPRSFATRARDPEEAVVELVGEDLDIYRRGNTYVLAVAMQSPDPELSAAIANTLTRLYMAETNDYTRKRISDVEDQLGSRLAELRAAALESQRKVEAYRAEHGLLSAERLTVVEQQLRDLNQQLSLIATQTNAARARWEEVSKLEGQPVDRLLASGALGSPLLNALSEQHSSLSAREAALSATLMPRHPSLQAVRDSKAALRADIEREVSRLVSQHRVEMDVAIDNEQTIRAQIIELEAATAVTNQASVELRDLERQSEADAAIYQQFLGRSKDAREQVNLPSETVRVISPAYPEVKPTWPKPALVLPAALAVGLGAGICLALALHLFGQGATPRRRAPGSLLGGRRA